MGDMELAASKAVVRLDPGRGGRIASLELDGVELLAPRQGGDWLRWGCYPMVPWAGRVRDGRFDFDGQKYQLESDLPPHAIHGVGYRASWESESPRTLHLNLEGLWPFGGWVEQRVDLTDQALALSMSVQATKRMPAMAGWHPCFLRQLSRGDPAELSFNGGYMWQRDDAGIPTGKRVPVPRDRGTTASAMLQSLRWCAGRDSARYGWNPT